MCFKGENLVSCNDMNDLGKFHEDLKIKGFKCPSNDYC